MNLYSPPPRDAKHKAQTWIGREAVERRHSAVLFHLLPAERSGSAGDAASGNLFVEGDNLVALKVLLP